MAFLRQVIFLLALSSCTVHICCRKSSAAQAASEPHSQSVETLPRNIFRNISSQPMDPATVALSALIKELPVLVLKFLSQPGALLYNAIAGVLAPFDKAEKEADAAEASRGDRETTFDFIVVGGGSAGAVVANRLSKYFKVLLLERGGEMQPLQYIPLTAVLNIGHPEIDYMYKTVPQSSSCKAYVNRWSRGRGLGGSSNLNAMMYIRGHVKDFDNWASITGDSRWSYENIRPYFLSSSEMGPPGSDFNKKDHDGVVHVEQSTYSPIAKEFLEGLEWNGIQISDVNEPYNDTAAYLTPLSEVRGRRCSTYNGFIEPVRTRANLTIRKHSQVYKVLFRKNRAIGVEYERHGKVRTAFATKEVVLSAGAIDTPKILMLSGIGPKERLDAIGIETLVDLPVGKNLHDHAAALLGPFIVNKPVSFLPSREVRPEDAEEFVKKGTGKFTSTFVNAVAFFPSSRANEEGKASWPDTQYLFAGAGATFLTPDVYASMWDLDKNFTAKYFAGSGGKDAFTLMVQLSRPKQRGELWLRSSDYRDDPLIDPKYFEDSSTGDIKVVVEGIKRAVNICENAPSMKKLGCHFYAKPFPGCEHVPHRSDEYWDCYTRHMTITIWHFVGTTAMGKRETGKAVVDSELRVYGTKGLRVIDAGIMPQLVVSNPNAAAIMIGERGSYFILSKYAKAQRRA